MHPILVAVLLPLIGLTHNLTVKCAEGFILDQTTECAEVRVLCVPLFRRRTRSRAGSKARANGQGRYRSE